MNNEKYRNAMLNAWDAPCTPQTYISSETQPQGSKVQMKYQLWFISNIRSPHYDMLKLF